MMYQGGIAKLDRKTGKVQTWSVPKEWQTDATQQSFASPTFSHVDGKVWVKNSDRAQILRLELGDQQVGELRHLHRSGDETNHRLLRHQRRSQQQSLHAGFQFREHRHPRRRHQETWRSIERRFPIHGRAGGPSTPRTACGSPNTTATPSGCSTRRPSRSRNGPCPTAWTNPYDVVVDKNGEAWTGSMLSDRIVRLDTKTGAFTEYLLPNPTNIRRVWVDNSTNPVTFWVGSNHGASIIKLEPLD